MRRENAGISEADDIGEVVSGDVRGQPRIEVLAGPAAGRGVAAKTLDIVDGLRESAVGLSERGIGSRLAKADDIGPAVAVYVAEDARGLVLAHPAAGSLGRAEPEKRQNGRCEGAVGLAERGVGS